jgi:4-alpha-glucanotransferase
MSDGSGTPTDTSQYGYDTLCTPSSHDNSTMRGWWEEDYNAAQAFYNSILGLPGKAPHFMTVPVAEKIVQQHLNAASMWVVFLMQVRSFVRFLFVFFILFLSP